ncbi:D111/G-patch domain-containing protein isoform X2 [Wolffia australiana]
MAESMGSNSKAIGSSNIGFQMLKKCGWKEGTGLGVSEQGRLEPLQTEVKKNKLGLGAETVKQRRRPLEDEAKRTKTRSDKLDENIPSQPKKKMKAISKRLKKSLEVEKRMEEKEFERAFFREFWPENV